MTKVTDNEAVVLALAKLDYLGGFDSIDPLREVLRMAQKGGEYDDSISYKVSTDFRFDGDLEAVVSDLVDKGWLDDAADIVITEEGEEIHSRNADMLPKSELTALKKAKVLYNS